MSGDIPVMVFTFEAAAKADKMLAWVGGTTTPKGEVFNVTSYKPTRDILEFVSETEAKIPYLYDDADSSKPPKNYCEDKGKISGNLTIGIGKIIKKPNSKSIEDPTKTNLEYWCDKSPLSNDEMWEMFENGSFKEHIERLQTKFQRSNVKYTQCQWDALASVVYNRGSFGSGDDYWQNNISSGTIDIEEDKDEIKTAFISAFNWDTAEANKWFKGLMCRRISESRIFIDCDYTPINGTKKCNDECKNHPTCKRIHYPN
jgi:GH24 family phage-related lysozyme (muramidase)